MNELTTINKVDHKEYGLEEIKAKEMVSGLNVTIEERKILEDAYLDVIDLEVTEENLPTFKELRLKIVKNRTQGLDKWKTAQKAYFLAGGNFVQAIYNKEVLVNTEMESKLMNAEKYFENLEKERIAKLQESRALELSKYLEDANERDLSGMDEDIWESFLSTKKQNYLDAIKAEQEAEQKRIEEAKAEAERIEAQRIENEKLKAEAEKREKEIELERKKQAELKAKEDAERERLRAIEQEKADKLRVENEAKLKAESEARLKIEAELKAKKDAEIKAEKERLELELKAKKEAEKLAKAPIKKQLNNWVDSFELPELTNDNEKALLIKSKFEAFKKWAKTEVESL
ncbi:hypothetical protein Phi10:1_gp019 [Cellulophaga phage phi10:1]|uniref:Uncharacterized protein n=1 Tax=Cellulophaga phage phi10:1 TaxID=1327981 RepID=S0A0M1_9CAUD|nr:hypothetical protein Phi10:1_gp019 [Cellulophaga phage phi10:1]AGO48360.1 hypothetical protein Phi10:1_gp019 [Cellulophaga phage phi10:1]